jgi:hypothetical protein
MTAEHHRQEQQADGTQDADPANEVRSRAGHGQGCIRAAQGCQALIRVARNSPIFRLITFSLWITMRGVIGGAMSDATCSGTGELGQLCGGRVVPNAVAVPIA